MKNEKSPQFFYFLPPSDDYFSNSWQSRISKTFFHFFCKIILNFEWNIRKKFQFFFHQNIYYRQTKRNIKIEDKLAWTFHYCLVRYIIDRSCPSRVFNVCGIKNEWLRTKHQDKGYRRYNLDQIFLESRSSQVNHIMSRLWPLSTGTPLRTEQK